MSPRLLGIFKRRDPELDCEDIQQVSSEFIDEELDETAKRKVVAHLEWCPPCSAFINTLRATVGLLRATRSEAPPPGFKERVRESIRRERAN